MKKIWGAYILPAVAVILLVALMVLDAHADEYQGPRGFHTVFRPLSAETMADEIAWQALNVVDMQQTVYIAGHPERFVEIGQVGWFTGQHPSKTQAIGYMVLFGVLHYATTRIIENLDCRAMQRVWEYGSIAWDADVVRHNDAIGIR